MVLLRGDPSRLHPASISVMAWHDIKIPQKWDMSLRCRNFLELPLQYKKIFVTIFPPVISIYVGIDLLGFYPFAVSL